MSLPLDDTLKIGVNTMLRRTEPATGPWMPTLDELVEVVEQVDRLGFDSFWCGDHVAFAIPFLDPITQIAQAAAISRRLMFGTAVFLLPLRHPTPVAKQIATLDHLTGGRFIFGVGIGGEFPKEYEGCGVPINERGPRLGEGIEVIRKLWTGERVSHDGRFYSFKDVKMTPTPRQPGGPPIWCGGRSDPALRRAARLADGWFSYAVSPEMFAKGLATIEAAAQEAGRKFDRFGTAHLMFTRIGDSYERALDEAAEVAQRPLCHEHAPRHRTLRRHRHPRPGGREDPRVPRRRRPAPEPRSRRPLRAPRRAVRALRRGGAASDQGLDGMSDAHMTFGFSEEQRQMRASVLGMLNRVLPQAKIRELDKAGEYPLEAHKALADGGYMGLMYPHRVRWHGRQLHGPRRAGRGTGVSLWRHRPGLRHHRDLCRHAYRPAWLGRHEARGAAEDHLGRHAPRVVPERAGSWLRCCGHRAGRRARRQQLRPKWPEDLQQRCACRPQPGGRCQDQAGPRLRRHQHVPGRHDFARCLHSPIERTRTAHHRGQPLLLRERAPPSRSHHRRRRTAAGAA